MTWLNNLSLGFGVAFTTPHLLYALFGSLFGTLLSMLPGIGPLAAVALLLPSMYAPDATSALIMLTCVYFGAQYGRTIATILTNTKNAPSAVVSAIDGRAMARQGRAGPALAAASLATFFAGCLGVLVVVAVTPLLAMLGATFGPAEHAALIVLALLGAVAISSSSLLKAMAMAILGLLLAQAQIGAESTWGLPGSASTTSEQAHDMAFAAIAIGLFALGEIIARLGRETESREVFAVSIKDLVPTRQDVAAAKPAVVRGSVLGALLGVLPGGGALRAAFASYAIEKKAAGNTISFGRGDIRGVAGPESAHSAATQTSFIPMLALGFPCSAAMALLIGALALRGIHAGPQVLSHHPQLLWGLIAAMWLCNAMLLLLNLPLIRIWIKLLAVPYRHVFPAVILLCCVGAYMLRGNPLDIALTGLFAVVGYALRKLDCDVVPMLLGFLLEPAMEDQLRQALLVSHGNWSTFTARPLSAGLLTAAALLVMLMLLQSIGKTREAVLVDD